MSTWYRDLVTELPEIRNGVFRAPLRPGLGTELSPEFKRRPDATIREAAVS